MSGQISQPKVDRPMMPDGYGVPTNNKNVLPWSFVVEQMTAARNYWIATASKDARPAVTPVWGAWLDGKLYFDGAPTTRRGRNISQNPRVVVHLESGDQVVILEGDAVILDGPPERALSITLSSLITAKYGAAGYSPKPDQWDEGGLFIFTPRFGMGWTKFPEDVTRWQFEDEH